MSEWKFHCDVLSVSENASPQEIKLAFRKLALHFHPDRNGGTVQSKEKFQRINISYRYLVKNLASRPALTQSSSPSPPPNPEPRTYRPPPPPRQSRADEAPTILGDFLAGVGAFLSAKPPSLPTSQARRFFGQHKNTFLQVFPALTAGVAATVSVLVFLSHSSNDPAPSRSPASSPRDDIGRIAARCEMMSFQNGNLVKKWKADLSEWDCDLKCLEWFHTNENADSSCVWKNREFRQHAANQNSHAASTVEPRTPSPTPAPVVKSGIRDDGIFDDHDANAQPEFVKNEDPDIDGGVPVEMHNIAIGQTETLEFSFTPKVWIGDIKLIHGGPGVNRKQVIIKPIRKGVTGILITDKIDQPVKKIIYIIE